jgi:hypothetical protein
MKRTYVLIACCFLFLQGLASAAGEGEYLQGEIVSSYADRIDLSLGDKVVINVGRSLGVAKGDIAKIARREADDPLNNNLGQCAVIETDESSAACEIVQSRMEIRIGDLVFAKSVKSNADAAFYPLALRTLHSVVNPYAPNRKLSVYVYGIFNENNDVTGLSERIKREIVEVLRQKSRIKLADSGTTIEAFYPSDDMRWVSEVKQFMKKVNIDVLVTGAYRIQNDKVMISIYKIDLGGDDRKIDFPVAVRDGYAQLATEVRVPYQRITKKEQVFCTFVLRPIAYSPMKEEKPVLIKFEADGNPFTEYGMKRDDFNIISPVDVVVKVDDETFTLTSTKPQQLVTLTKGTHRVSMSFRRGYYFNENLLYRSKTLLTKNALLDVTKSANLLVDVTANPLPDTQSITLQVFDSVGKERQLLRPIRRLEGDTLVETFKD